MLKKEFSYVNLVIILTYPNKSAFKYNELTSLYGGNPNFIWPSSPEAPGIIDFIEPKRQILFIEDRLQIQAIEPSSEVPVDFYDLIKKVLAAYDKQSITSYGFNFKYSCEELPEVKDIFDMSIKASSFDYIPQSLVRLTFKNNNLIYQLNVTDVSSTIDLHINVHHDENTLTNELLAVIDKKLKEDWDNAEMLIKEVLASDAAS